MRFVLIALVATGCAKTTDPVRLGKAAFTQAGCVTCHSVGASGPTTGTNLSYIGFSHSPEWLERWIESPHAWRKDTAMPEQPNVTPEMRKNIVAYLSTLRGQGYAEGKPWSTLADPVAKGQLIFNSVGCVGCHGRAGKGGFPNNNVPGGQVPNLLHVKEGFSKDELVKKIKTGVLRLDKQDPDGGEPLLWMPPWGQVLTDTEIDALAAYLDSNSQGSIKDW